MKTHCAIFGLGVLMALSANECQANLDGCDNFNDTSIDGSRWAAPFVFSGVGFLTETNQRLEFTTTGTPTAQDTCILQWILNTGSYTQDWELKVDKNIGMPVFTNASPQPMIELSMMVFPSKAGAQNNRFYTYFAQDSNRYVNSQVVSNGVITQLATANTSATNLTVWIVFDSSTKVLSAYFDDNAASCGYSWRPLGSTVVPGSWGMTTNEFSAVLMGIGKNVAVAFTNNVFFDNFNAASVPFPRFQIQHIGGNVTIFWPTNAPNFHLESTVTLSPPICWNVLTNVTTTVGTNFSVTDTISSQTKFFRLSRNYGCQ